MRERENLNILIAAVLLQSCWLPVRQQSYLVDAVFAFCSFLYDGLCPGLPYIRPKVVTRGQVYGCVTRDHNGSRVSFEFGFEYEFEFDFDFELDLRSPRRAFSQAFLVNSLS